MTTRMHLRYPQVRQSRAAQVLTKISEELPGIGSNLS